MWKLFFKKVEDLEWGSKKWGSSSITKWEEKGKLTREFQQIKERKEIHEKSKLFGRKKLRDNKLATRQKKIVGEGNCLKE